uniref:Uncharacterized protein n=1 Tax=Mola mola TaxID=94237 RepID=A0A3Q3XLD6_MOLML
MLSIPVPKICRVSPPHTPPPPYHPTPPLSRKTPPSSVSTPLATSSTSYGWGFYLIPSEPSISAKPPITAPVAPPLPAENLIHGVNFRSKEFLVRHKSAPTPKEDANIPLVTPSLLQMVRLRSICPVSNPGPQNTPQKPIRKSLSLKYPPHAVKTSSVTLNTPSVRLQEAIRMKTAAMSSRDGLPSRLGVRSPPHSCVSEQGSLSPKSPERYDMHKSPASTASFIFSRSTKMVVMETAAASSPEAQASLKQSLAAELMQVSDKLKTGVISNGGLKSDKVPPPIAKKPSQGVKSPSQNRPACSAKIDFSVDKNRATGVQHMSGVTSPETTSKSSNIICNNNYLSSSLHVIKDRHYLRQCVLVYCSVCKLIKADSVPAQINKLTCCNSLVMRKNADSSITMMLYS